MTRTLVARLLLAAFILSIPVGIRARTTSALGAPAEPTAKKVIRIGVAVPLTGDNAYFGETWFDGIKLAARQFKFSGRLAGAKIQITALDDAGDPAQAVTVAHRLVADGVDAVVGPFTSGETLPSEPVYYRAGLPELPSAAAPAVTRRGYKNVARLIANSIVQGMAEAHYARNHLHIKSVAVFNDSEAYGQSIAIAFVAAAKRDGITVNGDSGVSPTSQDYTSALSPVLAHHPQMLYLAVSGLTAGGLLCRQARALGFNGPILTDDELFDPRFITGCGPRIGQAEVGFEAPPYNSTKKLRRFAAAYKRVFRSSPAAFSVYGYNQMGFLLTAINAAQDTNRVVVIKKMHAITYRGFLGTERINPRGDLVHAPFYIYRVAGKGFQLVAKA